MTRTSIAVLWAPLLLAGCLVDEGRCSANQELNAAGSCVCIHGFIPDDQQRCQPCGEHELSQGDVCQCEPGYSRGADMRCAAQAVGVGDTCESSAQCTTFAPYCDLSADQPYCTQPDCESASDCSAGYACDTHATPPFCRRGPSGLGDPCTTSADCADKEASYCETNRSHVCMVSGCVTDGDCFIGYGCCDLSGFGLPTLCVLEGACPVP